MDPKHETGQDVPQLLAPELDPDEDPFEPPGAAVV
jgi:hypothetical protein